MECEWDLSQTNANEFVAKGAMTIRVECDTQETCISWRRAEVRRVKIIAPATTLLDTIIRVTWNEESSVERGVADQQLVMISVIYSHTVPQSIGVSIFPIVLRGRYGLVDLSLEVGLVSSLVVNKKNFCKLKQWQWKQVIPCVTVIQTGLYVWEKDFKLLKHTVSKFCFLNSKISSS